MTRPVAIDQLTSDWAALMERLPIELKRPIPLKPARLTIANQDAAEAIALESVLAELSNWTGWLRRESWIGLWNADPGPDDFGVPLDGEWVSPDGGKSARLVAFGPFWRLISYTENADGDHPVLREEVRMVSNHLLQSARDLRYSVFWSTDKEGQSRRLASRFTGFGSV